MKISQSKDYKKPLYAIGIAAVLAAVSVTGCGLETEEHGGNKGKRVDTGLFCKHDADDEDIELAGEVELAGEEDLPPELDGETVVDDDVILDGGVSVDYTVDNNTLIDDDTVHLTGGAPIDEG